MKSDQNENVDSKRPKSPRSRAKRGSKSRPRAARAATVATEEKVTRIPAAGTIARTKSLLLAALRVWELKRGIRD